MLTEFDDVRAACYGEIKGLPRVFDRSEHAYDPVSDTLLVTYKDIVIGGARIVGKFPEDSKGIPMDSDELSLEDLFPEFQLKDVPYCEFTRLAVVKSFRSLDLLHYIFTEMVSYSIAKGYKYLFSISSLAQARCNKQAAKAIGLPFEYKIHKDIEIPDKKGKYGELKVCISSLELPDHWKGIRNHGNILDKPVSFLGEKKCK